MDKLPSLVLLVFCLYLLVRWEKVKHPLFFLIGAVGILITLGGAIFSVGHDRDLHTIANVFNWFGTLLALAGFLAACYGGALPVKIPGDKAEE